MGEGVGGREVLKYWETDDIGMARCTVTTVTGQMRLDPGEGGGWFDLSSLFAAVVVTKVKTAEINGSLCFSHQ